MGAGKLPEQIGERAEEGRLDVEHKPDPTIEKMRAQPVERTISPEETNVRRELSAGAKEAAQTIRKKMALENQLNNARRKLNQLEAENQTLTALNKEMASQLEHYRSLAKRQGRELTQLKQKAQTKR